MKVVEKFISINGEGTRAGELATFIRFQGCNLECHYCDTKWANDMNCPFEELTPQEIVDYIKNTNVKNVTLTGGEPLLQDEIGTLLELLHQEDNIRVEIETNGSISLRKFCKGNRPRFTMDYKLPSSGCEDRMCFDNFDYLDSDDTIKLVVGNTNDLNRARELIERYNLQKKCNVYFSPVFGMIEPVEIVNYIVEHNMNEVRMQIQMHKFVWDHEKRGV